MQLRKQQLVEFIFVQIIFNLGIDVHLVGWYLRLSFFFGFQSERLEYILRAVPTAFQTFERRFKGRIYITTGCTQNAATSNMDV